MILELERKCTPTIQSLIDIQWLLGNNNIILLNRKIKVK